jgi:His-Xaa-Ser system protein HxsD
MNDASVTSEAHILVVDTSIYSLEAIKKAAYKFADRASIIINNDSNAKVSVAFNFVGPHAKNDPEHVISDFRNELLDQDLREIIKKETGALRNAIIAHAFSRTPLAERD